jgi:hypothetical protein
MYIYIQVSRYIYNTPKNRIWGKVDVEFVHLHSISKIREIFELLLLRTKMAILELHPDTPVETTPVELLLLEPSPRSHRQPLFPLSPPAMVAGGEWERGRVLCSCRFFYV